MSVLDAPHFHDEQAAMDRLEAILWPNGPVCPHCGNTEKVYAIKGKSARPGSQDLRRLPQAVHRQGWHPV